MKSITDLNNTWWYRLVKVLFCGIFLILIIISSLHIYFTNNTNLVADVNVKCAYGNKSTFNSLHDKGISINNYDPNKSVPEEMNAQILQACNITQSDIDTAKATAIADTNKIQSGTNCTGDNLTSLNSLLCGITISPSTYQAIPTLVTVNTPWKALAYVLIDIVILLCLSEIIRRLFYYIIIGKFKPL